MALITATIPRQRTVPAVSAPRRPRLVTAGLLVSGVLVMLLGYLRIARANPVNADGAANALQAWDMLHGNVALSGWTLSDVSFYPTELVQYALIELAYGLNPDVVHVAAATTYVLLIVFAALAARGDGHGRSAWVRAALVVAAMLVPEPHAGWAIVLNQPDHTGTGVPLLLTALLIDHRTALRRWWPLAVTALLALAQMGDPLALYIGALPLAAVSAARLARLVSRSARQGDWAPDAHLLVAAVASTVIAHGAVQSIGRLGGYWVHEPIAEFATWDEVPAHLTMLLRTTAVDYGAYFPYLAGDGALVTAVNYAAGAVKLVLMLAALAATAVTLARLLGRRSHPDRVAQWLAAAVTVNLAAFVASTQAADMASARQVIAVLPFGAVLAARVFGNRLAARLSTAPARTFAERPRAGERLLARLAAARAVASRVLTRRAAANTAVADHIAVRSDASVAIAGPPATSTAVPAEVAGRADASLVVAGPVAPSTAVPAQVAGRSAASTAAGLAMAGQAEASAAVPAKFARRPAASRAIERRSRTRLARLVVGVMAGVLVAAFAVQAAVAEPAPLEAVEAAAWLEQHDLRYGIGAYWASHTVTVATDGRVHVAPVVDQVPRAFHWESRAEWFDPRRHDARFIIVDRDLEHYGTLSGVVIRLGPPIQQVDLKRWTILVYDHNILHYLPRHQRP